MKKSCFDHLEKRFNHLEKSFNFLEKSFDHLEKSYIHRFTYAYFICMHKNDFLKQFILYFSRNTSLTLIKRDINISAFEIFSRLCRS